MTTEHLAVRTYYRSAALHPWRAHFHEALGTVPRDALDDDALRRWRTRYPGGVNEEMVFDSAGRVVQRTAASIGETVVRDAAGRVYEATVTPATGGSFAAVIRYNGLGAVVRATGVVPGTSHTEAVNYYSADEKLRVFNRQIGQATSAPGGVYEEYRYDALGRRVLVRSRSTAPCATPACSSYIERIAWDGARRLLEVRAPGKDNESYFNLNSDQAVGLATDNFPFGRVRYTHGPELDRPLAIIRENLQGHPTIVVAPHANWQGDYEVGTRPDGSLTTSCSGEPGCPIIGWPGHHTTADGEPVAGAPPGWYGGIISQSADQSGLQYMRNRYYDPRTGRFTQEDPIGLAGGLNLYGFAGGDPVNFSDPFGLFPQCPSCANRASLALANHVEGAHRPVLLTGGEELGHIVGGPALKELRALRGLAAGARGILASRALTRAATRAGVQILEREGSHIVGAFQGAAGEARFVTEIVRSGDDVIFRGLDIEGAGTMAEHLAVARRFGEGLGVRRVIIEPARRSTGANPGHVPRPLIIEIGK